MANGGPQGPQCEVAPVPVCDVPPEAPSLLVQAMCDGNTPLLADYRYVRLLEHIDPTRYHLDSEVQCSEAEVLIWNAGTANWDASGEIICVCDFVGNRMHKHDRAIVKSEEHNGPCGPQGPQGSVIWWIHEVHEFGAWVVLTDRDGWAFSWTEVYPTQPGDDTSPPTSVLPSQQRTGEFNAFDVNGRAQDWHKEPYPYPRVVWLRRDTAGTYLFNIDDTDVHFVQLAEDIDPTRWSVGSPVETGEAYVLEWDTIALNWMLPAAAPKKITVRDWAGNRMHKGDKAIVVRDRKSFNPLILPDDDPVVDDSRGFWWIIEVHEFGLWAKLTARVSNAYSWTEVVHAGQNASLIPVNPRSGAFNAFDFSNDLQLDFVGRIVWLRRGIKGQYVFLGGGGGGQAFRYVQLKEHIDPTRYYLGSPVERGLARVLAWTSPGDPNGNWEDQLPIEDIIVADFVGNRMHKDDRAIVIWDAIAATWWIVEVHEFGLWAELTDRQDKMHSWKEMVHLGDGQWNKPEVPRVGDLNAYEVNNSSHNSQAGQHALRVWMRRGHKRSGYTTDYVFDYAGTDELPSERYNFKP